MKTAHWIALFLVGAISQMYAQPYQSIFSDTLLMDSWIIPFADGGMGTVSRSFSIPEDSIFIDENVYHRIHRYRKLYPYELDSLSLGTRYRESTDHSKLWLHRGGTVPDLLLMDLNLVVGDSFLVADTLAFHAPTTVPVYGMVTEIKHELGRKIVVLDTEIHLNDTSYFLEFMEGIGPNAGFGYISESFHIPSSDKGALLCFHKNDSLVFHHPNAPGEDCVLPTGGVNIEQETVANSLTAYWYKEEVLIAGIQTGGGKFYEWGLYGLSGKKIASGAFTPNKSSLADARISLPHVPIGLYIFQVWESGFLVLSQKVLLP